MAVEDASERDVAIRWNGALHGVRLYLAIAG
jgi:hypothetical protein